MNPSTYSCSNQHNTIAAVTPTNNVTAAPQTNPYYNQIDALKGFAIFLVVLGHSIIVYPINLQENAICDFIFRWLSSVHMPLFFMVSGFCFSYQGNYRLYIGKKIKRLIIPYIAFNILDTTSRFLFPNLVNRPRRLNDAIYKIIFNGGETWFLYTLFIIFLFFPIIYKWIHKNLLRYISLIVFILIMQAVLPNIPTFTITNVINYIIYFTIGVIIKDFKEDTIFEIEISKEKKTIIASVLLAIWCIIIYFDTYSNLTIMTALIGIITLYICTQYKVFVEIFRHFGKYSLQLYLLNGYMLVISRTIIVSVLGITNPLIIISFNMLVDFVFSYLFIKYICEKIEIIKIFMGMH